MDTFHKIDRVAVIGAGSWGTAMAKLLSHNFDEVLIWTRKKEISDEINLKHTNNTYLPSVKLPDNIKAYYKSDILKNYKLFVNAVPTQYIRDFYSNHNISLKDKYIINGSKGIESESYYRISQIFEHVYSVPQENYCLLTGPSHAEEVSKGLPTTVVVSSENNNFSEFAQQIFSSQFFRVYTSHDVIGCELGGSLKNVIAIAAGVIDGMSLGDNTKAALITRGLAEITRMGVLEGADAITFSGLSGLGDLFVTCDSKHSRNRRFGELLGRGEKANSILESSISVVEGVFTSKSTYELSKKLDLEMPISEKVYQVIFEGLGPEDAIKQLMSRDSKREWY